MTFKMILILANIGYYLHQPYIVLDKNYKVVKVFKTLNAKAQCKHYAKWYGAGAICVKK